MYKIVRNQLTTGRSLPTAWSSGWLIAALAMASVAASAQEAAPIAKHNRWVTNLAFSQDGQTLATVGGESLQYRPGDVKLWNAKTGALAASLDGGHPTNVWSAALSSDGKTLYSSGYDGKVVVWDVAAKKATVTLDKHKGWVRTIALSPDGKKLATGGEDGSVVLWDVAGPKEEKTIKAHEAAVYALAFSPDGATLASVSTDKTGKLWNLADGAEKGKLEGHDDAVWAVAWSKDGASLATAGADRKVRVRDAAGKEQFVLEGHKDWISGLAFSPDGALLASSSLDRTVKLWDVKEKKEKAALGPLKSTVWCVAFSPDGSLLAAGSHEGVKLWKSADQSELFPAPAEKSEKK